MRKLTLLLALVMAMVVMALAGLAQAGPGGTKGPGDCGIAPGQFFSETAKLDGSQKDVLGVAPGQLVSTVCNGN